MGSSPGRVPPIIIAGPTGTAKSALAEALAGELDGGIISADSMLARSGLRIGNGRSTSSKEVVYHLVSNVLPDEIYFSNRLLVEARSAIEGICY